MLHPTHSLPYPPTPQAFATSCAGLFSPHHHPTFAARNPAISSSNTPTMLELHTAAISASHHPRDFCRAARQPDREGEVATPPPPSQPDVAALALFNNLAHCPRPPAKLLTFSKHFSRCSPKPSRATKVPLSTLAVRSIISQAHLLPLPAKLSPVIWVQGVSPRLFFNSWSVLVSHHEPLRIVLPSISPFSFHPCPADHALSIYPLPHIMFLCDDVAPFDVTVTGCRRCV